MGFQDNATAGTKLSLDAFILLPNYFTQLLLNEYPELDRIVHDVSLRLDQYLALDISARDYWLSQDGE